MRRPRRRRTSTRRRSRAWPRSGTSAAPVSPRTSAEKASLADPKDKLRVFAAVQQAGEMIVKDDYAAAARTLESALREDPKMPQALLMLGGAYAELGRNGEAKAQFDLVLKDDPKSVQALVGMASLLMKEGKTGDVVALCKRTLSLDDQNTQAYALLGEVYAGQKKPAEALPYLREGGGDPAQADPEPPEPGGLPRSR